uniref:cryptochrome-2-like isoform X4 n=1 Tax=Monopterus albus TaxID=43700 RepID=UPI0009B3D67B|nr:cryptochrome-2-like isoform X4 [Monopterus albus]
MVVNSMHWFRKGLRLHDNPALQEALNGADTVRCVYILDPWFAGASDVGINRWRFLLEALEDLDNSLKKFHSRLFVVRGQPTDVFPRLFKEWKVTRLTFEYDPEPYGKDRDGAIIKVAQEFGVETVVRNSHTLFNLDRIIEMNNNSAPLTFKRFQTIVSRLELPRRPLPPVTYQQMDKCRTKMADNHDQLYSIPSLEELGFRTEGLLPAVWQGGESEALDRLNKHLDKKIPWDQNPEALAKWAEGRTGFPWIDAIMTQLRQEGWIHHLARHAVACFLTRGDLWITWESGMKVFEELLLDADWSVNAGSWMWLSCSAFFQQFFHCYCPVGFGRRTDPSGDYIRRYIPTLKDYPNRYIYEPWNAPESVQKAANCVVGVDYPKPMINHAEGSRLNIERMKQVYQQLSHYRGLSLLASVPTIQEEAEPPMTDESQSSSGPDSPLRGPADTKAAPDSSTLCASFTSAPSDLEDGHPSQTPCTSSGLHTWSSAAITCTSASHPPRTAASLSPATTPAQRPLSRSKPTSPPSPCPTLFPSPGPATMPTQTCALGPRRKGLARKMRRSQRQRGRPSSTPFATEGERRTEEERMEEDVEQDEEQMEEETSGETAGRQQ